MIRQRVNTGLSAQSFQDFLQNYVIGGNPACVAIPFDAQYVCRMCANVSVTPIRFAFVSRPMARTWPRTARNGPYGRWGPIRGGAPMVSRSRFEELVLAHRNDAYNL